MKDSTFKQFPKAIQAIEEATKALGFNMASEPKTGSLLSTLASAKPGGRFLELGTGTGLSAAWILLGMDADATLISVDNDADAQAIAIQQLGTDKRVQFVLEDGATYLQNNQAERFDFIFADAWPGKFNHLDEALALLNKGGLYIIDDLLPQENWPEGHAPKVPALMQTLEARDDLNSVRMAWASGIMIVTKK